MNTSSNEVTALPQEPPRGRVYRNRWGWAIMNRQHFSWLTQTWFFTGYQRALDDIAAGRSTSLASRAETWTGR